jgi:hypothetical protein
MTHINAFNPKSASGISVDVDAMTPTMEFHARPRARGRRPSWRCRPNPPCLGRWPSLPIPALLGPDWSLRFHHRRLGRSRKWWLGNFSFWRRSGSGISTWCTGTGLPPGRGEVLSSWLIFLGAWRRRGFQHWCVCVLVYNPKSGEWLIILGKERVLARDKNQDRPRAGRKNGPR